MIGDPPLGAVVRLLDDAGVPHMLVGSMASSVHGSPRSTQDVDLVIDPDHASLERLLHAVDRRTFYVPDDAARAALYNGGQFNLVDLVGGWKVDLVVRKDRPFSRAEFGRRTAYDIDGVTVYLASAEDTVLAKLEWVLLGGSDRQVDDVVGILAVAAPTIDDAYLDRWAHELGVEGLLAQARRRAAS